MSVVVQHEVPYDHAGSDMKKSEKSDAQVDVIPVLSQMKSAFQVRPHPFTGMQLFILVRRASFRHQTAIDSCKMRGVCSCRIPAVRRPLHQGVVHLMVVAGAVQLACGDKEGAKKTQSNMTKGCPGISQVGCTPVDSLLIMSHTVMMAPDTVLPLNHTLRSPQIRSVVELAKGDKQAAKATQHQQYVVRLSRHALPAFHSLPLSCHAWTWCKQPLAERCARGTIG